MSPVPKKSAYKSKKTTPDRAKQLTGKGKKKKPEFDYISFDQSCPSSPHYMAGSKVLQPLTKIAQAKQAASTVKQVTHRRSRGASNVECNAAFDQHSKKWSRNSGSSYGSFRDQVASRRAKSRPLSGFRPMSPRVSRDSRVAMKTNDELQHEAMLSAKENVRSFLRDEDRRPSTLDNMTLSLITEFHEALYVNAGKLVRLESVPERKLEPDLDYIQDELFVALTENAEMELKHAGLMQYIRTRRGNSESVIRLMHYFFFLFSNIMKERYSGSLETIPLLYEESKNVECKLAMIETLPHVMLHDTDLPWLIVWLDFLYFDSTLNEGVKAVEDVTQSGQSRDSRRAVMSDYVGVVELVGTYASVEYELKNATLKMTSFAFTFATRYFKTPYFDDVLKEEERLALIEAQEEFESEERLDKLKDKIEGIRDEKLLDTETFKLASMCLSAKSSANAQGFETNIFETFSDVSSDKNSTRILGGDKSVDICSQMSSKVIIQQVKEHVRHETQYAQRADISKLPDISKESTEDIEATHSDQTFAELSTMISHTAIESSPRESVIGSKMFPIGVPPCPSKQFEWKTETSDIVHVESMTSPATIPDKSKSHHAVQDKRVDLDTLNLTHSTLLKQPTSPKSKTSLKHSPSAKRASSSTIDHSPKKSSLSLTNQLSQIQQDEAHASKEHQPIVSYPYHSLDFDIREEAQAAKSAFRIESPLIVPMQSSTLIRVQATDSVNEMEIQPREINEELVYEVIGRYTKLALETRTSPITQDGRLSLEMRRASRRINRPSKQSLRDNDDIDLAELCDRWEKELAGETPSRAQLSPSTHSTLGDRMDRSTEEFRKRRMRADGRSSVSSSFHTYSNSGSPPPEPEAPMKKEILRLRGTPTPRNTNRDW